MTSPFQDRQPGEIRPEREEAGTGFERGVSGCQGVLLLLLGIPPLLLGLFIGMCTLALGPSRLLVLALFCFGLGAGLIWAGIASFGGGAYRDNGEESY